MHLVRLRLFSCLAVCCGVAVILATNYRASGGQFLFTETLAWALLPSPFALGAALLPQGYTGTARTLYGCVLISFVGPLAYNSMVWKLPDPEGAWTFILVVLGQFAVSIALLVCACVASNRRDHPHGA